MLSLMKLFSIYMRTFNLVPLFKVVKLVSHVILHYCKGNLRAIRKKISQFAEY